MLKLVIATTLALAALAAPAHAWNIDSMAGMENAIDSVPARDSSAGVSMETAIEITGRIRDKDGVSGIGKLATCVRGSKRVVRCTYEDWTYDSRACVGRVVVRQPRGALTRSTSKLRCRTVDEAPEWTGLS